MSKNHKNNSTARSQSKIRAQNTAKHKLQADDVANLANTGLQVVGSFASGVDKIAGIVDVTSKVIDTQLERHKDDLRMPGFLDLPIAEAEGHLKHFNFQYSLVTVMPDDKYANVRPNTVLDMEPKAGAKVAANGMTFVKLYYADEETVAASQKLVETRLAAASAEQVAKAEVKKEKVAERHAAVVKLVGGAKNTGKSLASVTSKLITSFSIHKKTKVDPDVENQDVASEEGSDEQ